MSTTSVQLARPAPFSLVRTLSSLSAGRRDPTVQSSPDLVRFALLTPDGPVTVYVSDASAVLSVQLQGSGARWLEPHLPGVLGLEDDAESFQPDAAVARLVRRCPGAYLIRLPVLFHRLVKIVLHQLVTWQEAADGWRAMTHRFGEPAPGTNELRVGPSPQRLQKVACFELVECGILPRQARLILHLARDHRRICRAWDGGDEKLLAYLASIPGIGAWTLATLRGSCLGDPDAVVTGDYGLPGAVSWFFRRQSDGTDEEMLKLLEPYRGHRYRVQQLLMLAGVHAPRRGPRAALRSWM